MSVFKHYWNASVLSYHINIYAAIYCSEGISCACKSQSFISSPSMFIDWWHWPKKWSDVNIKFSVSYSRSQWNHEWFIFSYHLTLNLWPFRRSTLVHFIKKEVPLLLKDIETYRLCGRLKTEVMSLPMRLTMQSSHWTGSQLSPGFSRQRSFVCQQNFKSLLPLVSNRMRGDWRNIDSRTQTRHPHSFSFMFNRAVWGCSLTIASGIYCLVCPWYLPFSMSLGFTV